MKDNIDLKNINKIYFIGIGGIGISATARILKRLGKDVYGSDASESEVIASLRGEGIEIKVPQLESNLVNDAELVVYSVAVPVDNLERIKAESLGLRLISYPQLLGLLIQDKYPIGVSGTDGKTTTTAMIAKIFISAGLDPTVVLGSQADFLEGNARLGNSKYFVFESDEYRRAFDNYNPNVAVVTNIGLDHLDYFHDQSDYISAFESYLKKIPASGFVIINNDNNNSIVVAKNVSAKKFSFGIDNDSDFKAVCANTENGRQYFDVFVANDLAGNFSLKIPGKFNVYNALASIVVARIFNIDWEIIKKSLADFNGAWRRFERLGFLGNAEIIADYAHTPDAILKNITAVKEFFSGKKILFVFQPHQYNRTKNFFDAFAKSFVGADNVIISDIFYVEGRENPKDFDISSEKLVEAIKKNGVSAIYGGDLITTENLIRKMSGDFDVLMIMGAGNIYETAKNLIK
ncbi:MAG: UDP-N-acetylmuramate--L-alanine ligase [bacterium]